MFDTFVQAYNAFHEAGAADPLHETLHLVDLLSGGELRSVDRLLADQGSAVWDQAVQRRQEGMPLEYAVGRACFRGLSFICTPDTLIPRSETELLVDTALELIAAGQQVQDELTVIDVGTGCGNIAVSLAMHSQRVRVLASDISPAAIAVARQNVERYGLQDRIALHCGDLLAPVFDHGYEGAIDLVVCNPPYLPTGSLSKLAPEIRDYEPHVALDAGHYGLDIFARLVRDALRALKPGGTLVFEIGAGQDRLVTRLLERTGGYEAIQCFTDGSAVRVVSADRKTASGPER